MERGHTVPGPTPAMIAKGLLAIVFSICLFLWYVIFVLFQDRVIKLI